MDELNFDGTDRERFFHPLRGPKAGQPKTIQERLRTAHIGLAVDGTLMREAAGEIDRLAAEVMRLWRTAVCPSEKIDDLQAEVSALGTATPEAVRAIDAMNHRLDKIMAMNEIARLRQALTTANKQAEHFEREWYLRGDRIEELERQLSDDST